MRKLTKFILPDVRVEDLKIRPRGDNRCESANWSSIILFSMMTAHCTSLFPSLSHCI